MKFYIDKNYIHNIRNQAEFIGALFAAAKSKYSSFPERPEYGTTSYQEKIFQGSRPLNQGMKNSFDNPIDEDAFVAYFEKCIKGENTLNKLRLSQNP
jgi:hypothetical protein